MKLFLDLNFYQERIIFIKKLIQNQKYLKVLSLINEDLSVPYLPNYYEKEIKVLLSETQKEIQKQENTIHFKVDQSLTLNQLKKLIFQSKLSSFHPFLFFDLIKYSKDNIIKIAKDYLSNNDYHSRNKTFLLLFLEKQGIDHLFLLKKNDQLGKVNPVLLQKQDLWKLFQKSEYLLLNNFSSKETTIQSLAQELLMDFCAFFYPWFPSFVEPKSLVSVVIFQSYQMLGKKIRILDLLNQFNVENKLFDKINFLFRTKFKF